METVVQLHSGNQVQNSTGTGHDHPNHSSSWKHHWERKTGERWPICSQKRCNKQATDGSHVRLIQTRYPYENYIIPLCHSCNIEVDRPFEVKTVKAVRAY